MTQNARTIRLNIPSLRRTKVMPSLMLVITDWLDGAGVKSPFNISSDAITARYEIPFSEKHHIAPSLVSATPPSAGPRTRAKLN